MYEKTKIVNKKKLTGQGFYYFLWRFNMLCYKKTENRFLFDTLLLEVLFYNIVANFCYLNTENLAYSKSTQ